MDNTGSLPGGGAGRGLDVQPLTAIATPDQDRLGTSRNAANLNMSTSLAFSPMPVSSLGGIGLAGDLSSSSSFPSVSGLGLKTPDASFSAPTTTTSAATSAGGSSVPGVDIGPGLGPVPQPLPFNVPSSTNFAAATSRSAQPPPVSMASFVGGSALPATASSQLPQLPQPSVPVPQGHVPLIAVGTGATGTGLSFNPLPGMSPLPGMMTSPPSTTMSSVPPPPVMSSVHAYQVPHALAAPLPYGAEAVVQAESTPGVPGIGTQGPGEEQQRTAPLHHWFYCRMGEPWTPFSCSDSSRLETALQDSSKGDDSSADMIPTDGGRYDVDLTARLRHAVYWTEETSEVRRCTWFYKDENSGLFSPYSEALSDRLENEYEQGLKYNVWQRKIDLPGGQRVVMHNAQVVVDYAPPSPHAPVQQLADGGEQRPRVVQRGLDDSDELEEGESLDIEHLVFVVSGIGGGQAQRNIVQHVDDFRQSAQYMLQDHFPHRAGRRLEFLPVAWGPGLGGDPLAVERDLDSVKLPSCSRLRSYTDTALMDVMFYTSPAYCQSILSSVANEMERVLELFQSRHPGYKGAISAVGHSLGACILFDLLSHQGSADPKLRMLSPTSSRPSLHAARPNPLALDSEGEESVDGADSGDFEGLSKPPAYTVEEILSRFNLQGQAQRFSEEKVDFETLKTFSGDDLKELGIAMGPRKKLATFLREHNLAEEAYQRHMLEVKSRREAAEAARLAAERVRTEQAQADAQREAEQEAAGLRSFTYRQPGSGVGHVFVDYPQLTFPVQSFFALGSPIGMFSSMRGVKLGASFHLPTCPNFFNVFHPFDPLAYRIEPMVDADVSFPPVQVPHHKGRKRLHLELRDNLGRVGAQLKKNFMESVRQTWQAVQEFAASHRAGDAEAGPSADELAQLERERKQVEEELSKQQGAGSPSEEIDFQLVNAPPIGVLNGGRRIDYVLQERPFESFNEYMFAIQSHSSYWTSEDTCLLILRQLFTGNTVATTPTDRSQPLF